ncbi:MAG: TrmB family transcriptional regulator [Deltaproteobacteria bacterium]|nr:TrmB family transcriptional regulator [Deltaproteobacteria bacterium]
MPDLVVSALEQLGFTATDAKVYLGLVQAHPATGYELSKRTGVPRSAMYAVLARLEREGLVRAVQASPARYEPLPPQQLVARLKDRHQRSLDDLQHALERLDNLPPPPVLWATTGYEAILAEAEGQIRGSRQVVAASLWQREALRLAPALEDARARGVAVVLFSFTPLPLQGPRVYSYGITETELERYWPHKLIVVADRRRVLVGGAEPGQATRATVTDESALVEMALSTVVLDLTLLGQRLGVDTSGAVGLLTEHLAPLDTLLPPPRRT